MREPVGSQRCTRGMRKLLVVVGTAIAALVVVPAATHAGGWGVVSFDATPVVTPGEPAELGFTFLRHGVTPESSDAITFVVDGTDGTSRFTAVPDGPIGHHIVTIEMPRAGAYHWSVQGDSFIPIDLGTLDVDAPGTSGTSWRWDALQWGGTGLAVVLAGLAAGATLRPRRRRSPDDSVPAAV
jgi:hypothetical protein